MIIIKNIILFFLQIRHTDDFPSRGSQLVLIIHQQFLDKTSSPFGSRSVMGLGEGISMPPLS